MPEHSGGLGHPEGKLVHFTKVILELEKCGACDGYDVKVDKYCPRCIAQGMQVFLLISAGELSCSRCCFRCLPAAYETYKKMAVRFLCHCGGKKDLKTTLELPITKLF
jgi:hypothetical protein